MPEKIREWTLQEEIGRGGMGVVYRATHDILAGAWAVKVMLPQLADDEEYRRRFLSESTVLAGLRHINIISIQTPFQEEGRLYLPMELLTGQSLADILKSDAAPWQSLRAMDVIRQVAEGLAYVHGREPAVLHRDIKPENIQVMSDGVVKIFDFGLARPLDDSEATLTGKAIGTPDYMAPELLTGGRPTTRTDVFALGIVGYRLLAGRLPWDLARDMTPLSRIVALLEAHRAGLPDVRRFAPHADARMADLVMGSIAADPAARPADAREFLARLDGRSGERATASIEERATRVDDAPDPDSIGWGIGTVGDEDPLDVDFDSPMIPKDFDDEHHGRVIRAAGYRGRRSGFGAGVALLIVGVVLCAGGFSAWWLARDWDGFKPVMDRVNAVVAALAGDFRRTPSGAGDADLSVDATVDDAAGNDGRGDARKAAGTAAAADASGGGGGAVAADAGAGSVDVKPEKTRAERNAELAGIEWVRIEGGRFVMGQGAEEPSAQPAHEVDVRAFDMARGEVTVSQYRQCVLQGACTPPYWTSCRGYTRAVKGKTGKIRKFEQTTVNMVPESFRQDDSPVVCVDWQQAGAFADWVGGRLPSEAEWEFAAREGRGLYPWGDAPPTCKRAVMGVTGPGGPDGDAWGCGRESTWPVCSKKGGNTPSGLCDMAGNVMEWVADAWFDGYADAPVDGRAREVGGSTKRVCRGGAWYSYLRGVRSVFRTAHEPSVHDMGIGFRVVRAARDAD